MVKGVKDRHTSVQGEKGYPLERALMLELGNMFGEAGGVVVPKLGREVHPQFLLCLGVLEIEVPFHLWIDLKLIKHLDHPHFIS